MNKNSQGENIFDLIIKGYKPIPELSGILINQTGLVYDIKARKFLKLNNRNNIQTNNMRLSVAKLVLAAFTGQTYRAGHIVYLDGNRANIAPNNLKYARLFNSKVKIEVNKLDLKNAIRCYYQVKKNYSAKNLLQTKLYLHEIIEKRHFINCNELKPNIHVFRDYITGINNTLAKTAKKHGLAILDCSIIINEFTNMLINDILHELKRGVLCRRGFKTKEPTETEMIRKWNKHAKEIGQKPAPLRKQTEKEKIKAFGEFKNGFNSDNKNDKKNELSSI